MTDNEAFDLLERHYLTVDSYNHDSNYESYDLDAELTRQLRGASIW